MQNVLATLLDHHDLRFVGLAAFICALSAFAGMSLLGHARRTVGFMQRVWVAIAAVSVGSGIWATHFVAMLSYAPGMPIGYNMPLTLLSLAIAVVITGGGLWYATLGDRRSDMALAGAVVGIGIGSMHYVGMAAVVVGGAIAWDPALVTASLCIGATLGAAALLAGTGRNSLGARLSGAALLTLAICAMHFTAMGAVGLENCFPIVSATDVTPKELGIVVALGAILILLLTLGGLYLDLRDRRRSELEVVRMRGLADAAVEGLLVCDGLAIVTVNSSFLALVGQAGADPAGRELSDFFTPTVTSALLDAPNVAHEAELLAAGGSRLPVEVILREVDFGGRRHYAIAVRDLSARKKAEQHIRFLAHHDALTGLANRASFARRLDEAVAHANRTGSCFAAVCLDLDRFKEVNDLFGHAVGDALLQRVGRALQNALDQGCCIARLGGDEFAVLVPDCADAGEAARVAETILDAFRRDNEGVTTGALISASIGLAIYPENSSDAEQLMSCADTALYRAKEEGRGIYRFYRAEMGSEARDRRLLEHDLRHAVSRNQLHLDYQPQIDIQTGRVTGFEALLRWRHPTRGVVSPSVFIPVAEESGLILQIGDWALRTACADAARWEAPLTLAVNVSTVQIHSPDFAQNLAEVLTQTQLPPRRLEIEVTETALVRDITRAVITLHRIKDLGVSIAMDDFGTGYSSLANLRAFPFDRIKIDQSFIGKVDCNEQSAAIVRAVLGLGSGLRLPVIAEGVERTEELAFLRSEACAGAQGFLLGCPAPIDAFDAITSGQQTVLAHATPASRRTMLRQVS